MKCLPSRLIYNLLAWHRCTVPCTDCLCNTCFTADSFPTRTETLARHGWRYYLRARRSITFEFTQISSFFSCARHYFTELVCRTIIATSMFISRSCRYAKFKREKNTTEENEIELNKKHHNEYYDECVSSNTSDNIISVHRISNGLNLPGHDPSPKELYTYRSVGIINSIKKSRR